MISVLLLGLGGMKSLTAPPRPEDFSAAIAIDTEPPVGCFWYFISSSKRNTCYCGQEPRGGSYSLGYGTKDTQTILRRVPNCVSCTLGTHFTVRTAEATDSSRCGVAQCIDWTITRNIVSLGPGLGYMWYADYADETWT